MLYVKILVNIYTLYIINQLRLNIFDIKLDKTIKFSKISALQKYIIAIQCPIE